MTELYIDNQLVDLPNDFQITLVTENLYFSTASTYSYDIELPITPYSNNAKIFSNINRQDKRLDSLSYKARLIVNNKLIINGTAAVVGISNDSVSIQLLQGKSELNWKEKNEKTYIDELDMGNIGRWGFVKNDNGIFIKDELRRHFNAGSYTQYFWRYDCIFEYTNGQVATTPVINTDNAMVMNPLDLTNSGSVDESGENYILDSLMLNDGINYPAGLAPNHIVKPRNLAAQPRFSLIVNMIFEAMGYTIATNELVGKDVYDELFVANSTCVWLVADMLPHWTFVEFVEQLQAMFDCVVNIKADNTAEIILRNNFYKPSVLTDTNTEKLKDVIDEYQVEIDTEIKTSNADKSKIYELNYPDYNALFLGHTFDNVKIVEAAELTQEPNPNVFAYRADGLKVSSPKLQNNAITGYWIDLFEPSNSKTEEEFALKIVPINPMLVEYYRGVIQYRYNGNFQVNLYMVIPQSVGRVVAGEEDTIQSLLDNSESPTEKQRIDKLTVGYMQEMSIQCGDVYRGAITPAWKPLLKFNILTSWSCVAVNWQPGYTIGLYSYVPAPDADYEGIEEFSRSAVDYELSLRELMNDNEYRKNLYSRFYAQNVEIITSTKYNIDFVAEKILNVQKPFNIKNQLYAAEKIKYTISAKGFSRIAEGTFYKI